MDMLEVGRGLTAEEDKTHFGMWCVMSSPLLIGCDLNDIKGDALSLMQNKELIAVNQDVLGLQAYVVKRENGGYVLVKGIPLHKTEAAADPLSSINTPLPRKLFKKQSKYEIGSISINDMMYGEDYISEKIKLYKEEGKRIIIFDAIAQEDISNKAENNKCLIECDISRLGSNVEHISRNPRKRH